MAITTWTVQTSARTGISLSALATAPDATLGGKFLNSGAETLVVINGSGSGLTVTLVYGSGASFDGVAVSNRTVSVGAGLTFEIGPFAPAYYNDASGYMTVTFSAVTTITCVVRKNGVP